MDFNSTLEVEFSWLIGGKGKERKPKMKDSKFSGLGDAVGRAIHEMVRGRAGEVG